MRSLHVDDGGFVRAPDSLVYRRLKHIEAWPDWWPHARVRRAPAPSGVDPPTAEGWLLALRAGPAQWLRYRLIPYGWRHERGFRFDLTGDLVGDGEFWLEPTHGGTIVHHLFRGHTDLRHPVRVREAHRRAFRTGLFACKDALQLEARTSVGLDP